MGGCCWIVIIFKTIIIYLKKITSFSYVFRVQRDHNIILYALIHLALPFVKSISHRCFIPSLTNNVLFTLKLRALFKDHRFFLSYSCGSQFLTYVVTAHAKLLKCNVTSPDNNRENMARLFDKIIDRIDWELACSREQRWFVNILYPFKFPVIRDVTGRSPSVPGPTDVLPRTAVPYSRPLLMYAPTNKAVTGN